MLPFVFIPRPVFHRRTRGSAPTGNPPPVAVHVVSVEKISEHFAVWTFDADATYSGSGGPDVPQLMCETAAGIMSPIEVWQVSANQIAGNYDDGELVIGGAWQVLDAPENLDLDGGALVVPVSGILD